jgi:hypothetical protein
MRLVKKLGPDRYIEYDSESGRIWTVEMTRNELYSHLLRGTWEDNALYLVEKADREYDEESKQLHELYLSN